MSGGNLAKQFSHGMELNKQLRSAKSVPLAGKVADLASNAAISLAKKALKQAVKRTIDKGIGY